ncbi:MAG: hypothetical protein CO042_01940, partial [Parcubacteria group bacterium CG_4_9_14_0_2_um_filter_41_8]
MSMMSGRPPPEAIDTKWEQSEVELPNLVVLASRLKATDWQLIRTIARRMHLALQVEEFKRKKEEKIYRRKVETDRMQQAREWAQELGINPDFVASILYLLIGESCKMQMIQMQDTER